MAISETHTPPHVSGLARTERHRKKRSGERAKVRMFLPYMRQHVGALSTAAVLSLVVAATTVAQPFLVQLTLDRVAAGGVVTGVMLLLIGLVLVSAAVEAVQYYALNRAAEEIVFDLRSTLVNRVLRLPMSAYLTMRDGDISARATSDTTLVRAVVTSGAVELLGSSLIAVGAVIGMTFIDPMLTAIVVAILLASAFLSTLFGHSIQTHSATAQSHVGGLAADLNRATSAISTIRASNATDREVARLRKHAERAKSAGVHLAKASALLVPANRIATQAAFAVILAIGGWRVIDGTITVSSLVAFIMMLFLLVNPLGQVIRAYMAIQTALGAMGRIDGILSSPIEHDMATAEEDLPQSGLDVAFSDVRFGYKPGSPVLQGVSLHVRAGEFAAIVGESGAGKSTMFSLLERFYEPDSGSITLGGIDITTMARSSVRRRIAYVEQSNPILAGTVRENLKLGSPESTDDECIRALIEARLDHLVGHGTDGLDSLVGEQGKMLSGGEQQRLAIARALLTNKPILVLDEPSSSLDPGNEEILRKVLRNLGEEHTVIVITHRFSTVKDADRVYVLEHGRLSEHVPATKDLPDSSEPSISRKEVMR